MRVPKIGCGVLLAAALLLPSTSAAQRSGEIVFYREMGFRGQSFRVSGTRPVIKLNWTARSVRIREGQPWQVCPRTNFGGRCHVVDESDGNIRWSVRSARPLGGRRGP